MDCPQCEGTLATYALGGREASVCEDCGYVGIAAEHRGDPHRIESWDEALRRFYRAHGADAEPGVQVRPPLSRPSEDDAGESWDEALRRFYDRRTGGSPDDGEPEGENAADESPEDGSADADDTRATETSAGGTEEADASEAETETTRTSQSSAGDS
ncbi:hypothetical protein [Haloplanus pelagicus]|uniref:hypothetical protein n=1 Tax=Haloplanus pelagicus TaxID=2949995 RepID=UPI00203DAEBE|nr:hypothetical protein [Haloplanus sp. HW8-1]